MSYSFARHETFHIRTGWLRKGLTALKKDKHIFLEDKAMEELGIGKNMVSSLRYWLQAVGLTQEEYNSRGQKIQVMTELANDLLDFDKYFEEIDGQFKRYQLSSKILDKVKFEQKDLINGKFKKDDWDLIISRNFFIYLTKEYKNLMIEKFTNVLKDNRYFFIGSTEFIFGSEKFNLKKENLSFYKKYSN